MKRTRRAALAMLAGSSSLFAVETLGYSSVEVGREMSVGVVPDAEAYLSLIEDEDGVETSEVLFGDGESRVAPATFDVKNQLTEPMTVVLESDAFVFDPTDKSDRVLDDDDTELAPGCKVEVTVDLYSTPEDGSATTDEISISATGDRTTMHATRELTLVPATRTVELTLCRGQSSNCVEVVIELTRDDPYLEVDIEIQPPDDEIDRGNGRVRLGDSKQFEVEFDDFGSSENGNWNVTAATPPSEPRSEDTKTGDEVTIRSGNSEITVDPDAAGDDETVTVTVTVNAESGAD